MGKDAEHKRDVEIIVNGTSYGFLPFPEGIALQGLLAVALDKTKNAGQPPENWDLKDSSGTLLDLRKHLRDYEGLAQIWLTVKAGVGGEK